MSIMDSIENKIATSSDHDPLLPSLKSYLLPNEVLVKQGLATWQPKPLKVLNVDLALTNQRLIVRENLVSNLTAATAAGLSSPLAGVTMGDWTGEKTAKGIIFIPFSTITNVTPAKYKLFGLIPTKNNAIVIKTNNHRPMMLLFRNRDEWLKKFQEILQLQH